MVTDFNEAPYLALYHLAASRHGGEFGSLCWTSPHEQTARFEAMVLVYDFAGKCLLDAGCGRADFYDFLIAQDIQPSHYTGIEAIGPLAERARSKSDSRVEIVEADFVRSGFPANVKADVITFSGSLNTLKTRSLAGILHSAMKAAKEAVVFNFLCTQENAIAPWLVRHTKDSIRSLLKDPRREVRFLEGYLDGDVTAVITLSKSALKW